MCGNTLLFEFKDLKLPFIFAFLTANTVSYFLDTFKAFVGQVKINKIFTI